MIKIFIKWILIIFTALFLFFKFIFPQLCFNENQIENYSINGNGKVCSYYINLDKSKERMAYVKPKIEALGFENSRISAIYGKNVPITDDLVNQELYKIVMHKKINPGTMGCSLSHIKLWKTFLESNYSYALIFEDDVDFDPKILRQIVDLIISSKLKWGLINFNQRHNGSPETISKIGVANYEFVKYYSKVTNTGCYLIDRPTAIKLLKTALPIFCPIDHYIQMSYYFNFKYRGVNPVVVKQSFGDSEITNQQNIKKEDDAFIYKISSILFQIFVEMMTRVNTFFDKD